MDFCPILDKSENNCRYRGRFYWRAAYVCREGGQVRPLSKVEALFASNHSGDLLEGRVGKLKSLELWSSFHDVRQSCSIPPDTPRLAGDLHFDLLGLGFFHFGQYYKEHPLLELGADVFGIDKWR